MDPKPYSRSGFTLIELTIVVAVIGILAAIAIPDFLKFNARARQTEAKTMLPLIAAYEHDYKLRHGAYLACPLNPPAAQSQWDPRAEGWAELGFEPIGRRYYAYEVELIEGRFEVKAVGNVDDDPNNDVWMLYGDSLLTKNIFNDVAE